MAKTKSEIFTLIGQELPDNTTGLITPAKLRGVLTQMADSPIYATPGVKEVEVLRAASTVTQAPTAVDTALQLTFGPAQVRRFPCRLCGIAPEATSVAYTRKRLL